MRFRERSKERPKDFTRDRKVGFVWVLSMILNLARRSTQIELDPFRERLWPHQADETTDTKPSFGEARQKIRPEAFTEWNTVFVNRYYDDEEYRTFRGFRVCAIDGSSQQLPNSSQLRAEYGGATGKGSLAVAKARASPLDDVLNGIVVDARIAPFRTGERELARQPREAFLRLAIRQIATIMLFDRGYPGTSPRTFPRTSAKGMPSLPLLFYLISHHIRPVMRVPVSFYPKIIGVARSNTWVTLTLSSAQARHGGRSDRGHRGPAPRHQTTLTHRADRSPRHHVNRRRNAGRRLWRIVCPAVGDRSP
ncbi:MAG: hypothetical protein M1600_07515 [Firmicutes bacterium]|nr:hypothetical protein [Bacillota bacterium]